ncbi:protein MICRORCHIDIA 6-like isoform X2 [Typha latifolia]|uniref:protein MICRORCHIDIA 6-like isoform X2 n=1 Tax=Typha latifolia TaxID=4733 RepID=UPI003C2EB848
MDQESSSSNGFYNFACSPGSMPFCRQFWKAGDYEDRLTSEPISQNGQSRLRIHPKFLHSNATSHKWAFGAIAELLDNAVDEVKNGATFVKIERITDSQDGSHALLIHDDGGGMSPDSLRRCMSFGFSDKHSESSIGQYGNGFKTSTMRLGSDVIVFSRCMNKGTLTQSVGLLSYTFLRKTGCDDIIVPMADYEFDPSSGVFKRLFWHGQRHFSSNLSVLLKWTPFATEVELMKQFNDIGYHGTKIIVFNLWLSDTGELELDFTSDVEDIVIRGAPQFAKTCTGVKTLNQKHIANRFRYSLRVYASILYLHLPENFKIILCGRIVDPHHIVNDLKYRQCIKYKPNVGASIEAEVITTIGFLEGAPNLNVHGFNVYHRNRLILPTCNNSKGKGVAGVLEANFIKPTHDKQDFEKSTLFQKLEARLREMTVEYWRYHCHLVGYSTKRKYPSTPTAAIGFAQHMPHRETINWIEDVTTNHGAPDPPCETSNVTRRENLHSLLNVDNSEKSYSAGVLQDPIGTSVHIPTGKRVVTALNIETPVRFSNDSNLCSPTGVFDKRKYENHFIATEAPKRQTASSGLISELGGNQTVQHEHDGHGQIQEFMIMLHANKKLHTECLEYETAEKQLLLKALKLKEELQEAHQLFEGLMADLKHIDEVKLESLLKR